jgi:hypothetical protein
MMDPSASKITPGTPILSVFVAAPLTATVPPMKQIIAPAAAVRDTTSRFSTGVFRGGTVALDGPGGPLPAELGGGSALIRTVLAKIRY